MKDAVILSQAKDLLAGIERREMILRFAQDDTCQSIEQLQQPTGS